mmetsp:Transcript_28000/g.70283  ORF Transcript_28000/g.70283 Transcript_28000/m.70283 type:complete len:409 (-) Transcript_28000:97-1323(-)
MAASKLDIVVWGATGFTGSLTAEYLAEHAPATIKWGIAGRSRARLEGVRDRLCAVNPKCKDLPILIGDSSSQESIDGVVSQTRVVISCAGPFNKYGTPVVDACVRFAADYCDITGEYPWVRTIVDKYHEKAQAAGVRIVPCCGFDSIPSDLGTLMVVHYIKNKLGHECGPVKQYLVSMKGGVSGGTIASMVDIIQTQPDPAWLTNPYLLKQGSERDAPPHPDDATVRTIAFSKDIGKWTGPGVMAAINTKVVHRSNSLLHYGDAFTYNEVSGQKGFLPALLYLLGLGLFVMMMYFSLTRALLQRLVLPKPGEGPSKAQRDSGSFHVVVVGQSIPPKGTPSTSVMGAVHGIKDPGYGETAKMLAESGMCLALDRAKTPKVAGVLTPASSMGEVLIQRLRAAGMTFAITQ